jgi:hypothetical protein
MSSSRNTSSARVTTPFCKVCRDAGRPESEYTSHFVKDQPGPNGKVVCPMLLNQACRICHNTGHTSSYCPQYRPRREEPRREERYIEREREPRREERYIEREPRREERYIEREQPRRDISFNHLRDDTDRRDREIQDRNESYHREQDRRSKPWLQAALKPAPVSSSSNHRRGPYAHPHGPRVRLNLESTSLYASKHASPEENQNQNRLAIETVRKVVNLNHATKWGDEDVEEPFVCDPEKMFREFAQEHFITPAEHKFIEQCDDQSEMPFNCGY